MAQSQWTATRIGTWSALVAVSAFLIVGTFFHFLPFQWIEVFGFVSGAVTVLLVVEQNVWTWPIGIVNNIVFIVLFWEQELYADMGLQVVYIVLSAVGWYVWLFGGKEKSHRKVGRVGFFEELALVVVLVGSTYAIMLSLESVKGAAPFLDALTTSLSLVAQYLLTKKAIENWFVWITADVLYIGLYLSKGLVLTAILYALFLALCVAGWIKWAKSMKADRDAVAESA